MIEYEGAVLGGKKKKGCIRCDHQNGALGGLNSQFIYFDFSQDCSDDSSKGSLRILLKDSLRILWDS